MKKSVILKIVLGLLALAAVAAASVWLVGSENLHTHCFGDWVITKSATCQEVGRQERVCDCGERETAFLPQTDHSEGDWVINLEPTCISEGSKHTVCTMCGKTVRISAISPLGHLEIQHEAQDPTCEEFGWASYLTCERCDLNTYEEIEPLGHVRVDDAGVLPTCTETGLTAGAHCSVCHAILEEREIILTIPHDEVTDPSVAPTCTENGTSEGRHCSVCGTVLAEQTPVHALGHQRDITEAFEGSCTEDAYVKEICSACGDTVYTSIVPSAGHLYGEYITLEEPSCDNDGLKARFCTVCQTAEEVAVPATGHVYVPITRQSDGSILYECSRCETQGQADGIGDRYKEDKCTELFDCPLDFRFTVISDGDESYVREHIHVFNQFFEGTEHENDPRVVPDLIIQDQGNGSYLVAPAQDYESGMTYGVTVFGDVTLPEICCNSFTFSTEASGSSTVKYSDGILFISLPQENDSAHALYAVDYSEATGILYLTLPETHEFTEEHLGRIVCVGDYSSADELLADPSKRCDFGKLVAIKHGEDGRCILELSCPALDEIFAELDVCTKTRLALTEEDIPENASAAAINALLESDDFAEFIVSAKLASEEYAAKNGVILASTATENILNEMELTPKLSVKDNTLTVIIDGILPIGLKSEDGAEAGFLQFAFQAETSVTFDLVTICQLKRSIDAFVEIQALDLRLTQSSAFAFRFNVTVHGASGVIDEALTNQIYTEQEAKCEDRAALVSEVKALLKENPEFAVEELEACILEKACSVADIFTVTIRTSLTVGFQFDGAVNSQCSVKTTNVYGVRLNHAERIETYHAEESTFDEPTLSLVGESEFKLGTDTEAHIRIVGLSNFVHIGMYTNDGVYGKAAGVLEADLDGTGEKASAARLEAGTYCKTGFEYEIFSLGNAAIFPTEEKETPQTSLGDDKVYYGNLTENEPITATSRTVDLNAFDLLTVNCFDVRTMTSSVETLSLLGKEGEYTVRITLLDGNGNELPYCTVKDGILIVEEGAPCVFDVTVQIIVEAADGEATGFLEREYVVGSSRFILKPCTVAVHYENHILGDWEITTAPTCTKNGAETQFYICGCTDENGVPLHNTRTVDALGHRTVQDPAVKESCETDGYTAGSHCTRCNKIFVSQVRIPSVGHRYADTATCHDRACLNGGCDHVEYAATAHKFSEWIEVSAEGCATSAYLLRYCGDCKTFESFSDPDTAVSRSHDPYFKAYKNPTCTEDGLYVLLCRNCDVVLMNRTPHALGHLTDGYRFDTDGHYEACAREGCGTVSEKEAHTFDHGCDNGCNVCDYQRITEHRWSDPYTDHTHHWFVCEECTKVTDKVEHKYTAATVSDLYQKAEATCEEATVYYYSCAICGVKGTETFESGAALKHNFNETLSHDGTYHWHACMREGCDKIAKKEEHSGGLATCTDKAICKVCNAPYGSTKEHDFRGQIASEKYLKSAADCDDPAVYYHSCVWCGKAGTETFENGTALGHDYTKECITDGTYHWRVCARDGCNEATEKEAHLSGTATCSTVAICSACGTAYGSIAEHDFSRQVVSEDYFKAKADCEHGDLYYYSCIWCGEASTEAFESGAALKHNFNETLSHDGTYHWHACMREGCDKIAKKEEHSGGLATCTDKAICAVCNASYGSTEGHDFSGQIVSEKYLKSAADCDDPAVYYHSCVQCGEAGAETFENGTALGHSYAEEYTTDETHHWYVCTRNGCSNTTEKEPHEGGTATCTERPICTQCDMEYGEKRSHAYTVNMESTETCVQAATCEQNGVYYYSCACGAIGSSTFETDALAHEWGTQYYASTDGHYRICTRNGCGKFGEILAHVGGNATCTEKATCTVCDTTYGELADHCYDKAVATDEYLATAATCEKAATYYYSCVCGKIGTTAFTDGVAPGHSWSEEWSYDLNGHYRTCLNGCGAVDATASHSMGDYKQTIAPSCINVGQEASVCDICGYTVTREIDKLEHDLLYNQLAVDCTVSKEGESVYIHKIVNKCKSCTYAETVAQAAEHLHESNSAIVNGTEPTCTEDGLTLGLVCNTDGCGETLIKQETVPALGHEYVSGVCSRCGECETNGSVGLKYKLSDSGSYYILTGIGTCTDTEVVIPSRYRGLPVLEIGTSALEGCTAITKITILSGITTIGNGAFSMCTGLTDVTVPDGITAIGALAFNGCSALTSIALPEGIQELAIGTFIGCTSLEEVTLPQSLTAVGSQAFSGCTGLSDITLPEKLTAIGAQAFRGCGALNSIQIPSGVTTVGADAFVGCSSLTLYCKAAAKPEGWVDAWNSDDCPVVWNYGSAEIKGLAYTPNGDGTYSVSGIGTWEEPAVVIPDTYNGGAVTGIRASAFNGCTQLTSVTFGQNLSSIGENAFAGCTGLTEVTIPGTVTSMGWGAFYGCTNLKTVTVASGVTEIGPYAFYRCENMTSLSLPTSLKVIGDYAFYLCGKLPLLTLPNNVETIGSYAFYGASTLLTITVPSSVTSIGTHAFAGASKATDVTVGENVSSMGSYAFAECTALKKIWYNATNMSDLGAGAFQRAGENSSGVEFYIGSNVKRIPAMICESSDSGNKITKVVFASGSACKEIGAGAFKGCTKLQLVTLQGNLKSIGDYAFDSCNSILAVYYSGTATKWKAISIGVGNERLISATRIYS